MNRSGRTIGCLVGLVLLLCSACSVIYILQLPTKSPVQRTLVIGRGVGPDAFEPVSGSRLESPTSPTVMVCASRSALTRMVYDAAEDPPDTKDMANLVATGQAWLVPDRTGVRVINRDTGVREVTILEGDYAGKSGWVPAEWVR